MSAAVSERCDLDELFVPKHPHESQSPMKLKTEYSRKRMLQMFDAAERYRSQPRQAGVTIKAHAAAFARSNGIDVETLRTALRLLSIFERPQFAALLRLPMRTGLSWNVLVEATSPEKEGELHRLVKQSREERWGAQLLTDRIRRLAE